MRLLKAIAIAVTLPCSSFAQDPAGIEKLMTKRLLNCTDIAYNCSLLIPGYFHDGKIDTVQMFMAYWEGKCGIDEPLMRVKILLAINEGRFQESLYDDRIIDLLLYHQFNMKAAADTVRQTRKLYSFYPLDDGFDLFTVSLAQSLLIQKKYKTDLERLFCEFYGGAVDALFLELSSAQYDDTQLKAYYLRYLGATLSLSDVHFGLSAGYWMPSGSNDVLGNHPAIGALLGGKFNKLLLALAIELRFLKAKETYTIRHDGRLIESRHFLGGFLGVEGGRELLRTNRHEIDLIGGMGLDGFDALSTDNDRDGKSVFSLNLNLGLGYRHFLKAHGINYIGVEIRHNWLNYATGGGTDLSGNAISLRLIYGILGNAHKNDRLKALGHSY